MTNPEAKKLYARIEARAGRRLTTEELQRHAERLPSPDITAPVTITASTELLALIRDTWSPPVQVYLHLGAMGWEMTFRTHDCAEHAGQCASTMDEAAACEERPQLADPRSSRGNAPG